MKNILTLAILFTLLCFTANAQSEKPNLKFKNSILYEGEIKLFSYKPTGEIIFYKPRNTNGEIEMKVVVTTLNGTPFKVDTMNLDSLRINILMVKQGIGQFEKWIFNSITTYHNNGKIQQINLFSDGGKKMLSSAFDDKGRLVGKGNYIGKKKDGEFLIYDENGKIARKENYKDGVRGDVTNYFPNGKIAEIETGDINKYSNIKYDENGNIMYKKEIKNGSGLETEYNKNGHILKRNTYENEKIIIVEQVGWRSGSYRKYYENEKIWYDVEIKNGHRLETQYDADAHIIKQNTFEISENITSEKFADFNEK